MNTCRQKVQGVQSVKLFAWAVFEQVTVYGDPKFAFPYVPSHLHHMTFELVRLSPFICSPLCRSLHRMFSGQLCRRPHCQLVLVHVCSELSF